MPTYGQIELRRLLGEAFLQLRKIPSYEKQRCIDNMANYLSAHRPVEEFKAFKRSDFEQQWKICMLRICLNKPPFKNYNVELALSCA